LTFRAGFSVASDDTAEINGNVKADAIPAGRALHHTHVGPYATLRDDYDLMMDYVKNNDLEMRIPSWELYINDPSQVSESELITECYTSLA
jgi:effector-binding domain-containing protein